jgi:DNA polymerase sigma
MRCCRQSPRRQNLGCRIVLPLSCTNTSNNRHIQCDINVNNSLAIENTRLVKLYVDIDERVRPLAMIIKYWAKSRLLNDAAGGGTLTSYTWILMVINFLQTRDPPILPSLQMLHHRPRMSNGIDVGFFDDVAKLRNYGEKNTETLGGLLYAFFVR